MRLLLHLAASLALLRLAHALPSSGWATVTHYDLPSLYLASCGCAPHSTDYPTAALSRAAYGSLLSFGPACGACYRLTLLSTPLSPPPPAGDGYVLDAAQQRRASVVVKVTDVCPGDGSGTDYCAAQAARPNAQGAEVHWDLAWPAKGIAKDFFPGTRDYGVWNATYARVACSEWAGYSDAAAGGSVWDLQDAACCPLDPSDDDGGGESDIEAPATTSSATSAAGATARATSVASSGSASNSGRSSSSNSTLTSSISLSPRSHHGALHAHRHRRAPFLAGAQASHCPSYSALAASGQLNTGMVPNTSNPYARIEGGAALSSGARRDRRPWGWSSAVGAAWRWREEPPLLARMEL